VLRLRARAAGLEASGTGAQAQHRFEEPGLYEVVYLVNGEGTQRHELAYAVDYQADHALECLPVHAAPLTRCTQALFPVGRSPGLLTLDVQASGVHPAAELVVTDEAGVEVLRAPLADGVLEQAVLREASSPWTLAVEVPVGITARADIAVHLVVDGGAQAKGGGSSDALVPAWLRPSLRELGLLGEGPRLTALPHA